MKAEEAKKKWCPFGRIRHKSAANRNLDDEPLTWCIADWCMMWDEENGTCGLINAIPPLVETAVMKLEECPHCGADDGIVPTCINCHERIE